MPRLRAVTSVLGSEWLRTTAALDDRLDPAVRQEILRRAAPDSDPARFVRGRRTMGSDAA